MPLQALLGSLLYALVSTSSRFGRLRLFVRLTGALVSMCSYIFRMRYAFSFIEGWERKQYATSGGCCFPHQQPLDTGNRCQDQGVKS